VSLLDEVAGGGPLHDALLAGIADISQQRTVSFTIYTKVVLPLDGFVFWLRSSGFEATGALHFMSEREQAEDETTTRNSVVFTTGERIAPLNQVNTQQLIVGDIDSRLFAFDKQGWFFEPAGIWHYTGDAVRPGASTQLIDDPAQLDPEALIVSNSLPAWLALVNYTPIWLAPLNPGITLYPSYLVPDNLPPPYGAVHVEPGDTRALQPLPHFDVRTSHYQLTSERVRVTLFGANNAMAADFLDLVNRYSLDTDVIGMMGATTTVRDEKRPWPPGMVLEQRKSIEFEISYYQTRINDIARQMILDAQAAVITPDMMAPKICSEGVATVAVNALQTGTANWGGPVTWDSGIIWV
jgi:hypothetical protein